MRKFQFRFFLALVAANFGGAATAQTTPRALFEQATPSGAGNTVTIYRAPVITSTGAVQYKDVQIQFDVSAAGVLTVKPGFPVITASPVLTTGSFLAGRYKIAGDFYQLSGPGVGPGGRTTWSLTKEGSSCSFTSGWTSGAIAGHPLQARLNAARITYPGYSYGTMGNVSCTGGSTGLPNSFGTGHLIGVAGSANGLTIFNYTSFSGVDQSSPVSSASFQRCLAATC